MNLSLPLPLLGVPAAPDELDEAYFGGLTTGCFAPVVMLAGA